VQYTLGTWRLGSTARQVEAAALQLVRGAIEATGSMDEHLDLKQVEQLGIIVVELRHTENAVVVEVWDESQEPPSGPAPAGYRSGYFMLGGGKVVWTAVAYLLPRQRAGSFSIPPPVEFSEPSQYSNTLETVRRVGTSLSAMNPLPDVPGVGAGLAPVMEPR